MEVNKSPNSLILLPEGKIVPLSHGESVLESCLNSGVSIDHSCGGMGVCGTCRVILVDPKNTQPERNEIEGQMALDRGFSSFERLACQIKAEPGMKIELPQRKV